MIDDYNVCCVQDKLEEVVEMLSQVVNRPYLRTPQDQIREMARNVDHTCEEYLNEMKEVARAAAQHSIKVFKRDPPTKTPTPPRLRYIHICSALFRNLRFL